MNSESSATTPVRETFNRAASQGWRPESVSGATDLQITTWAADQGVTQVPAVVREVLRMIGVTHGYWMPGTLLGVNELTRKNKEFALATVARIGDQLQDSNGLLVLTDHQAYEFLVIDGADMTMDDPPIWIISEEAGIEPVYTSVTTWFESIAPQAEEYRARYRRRVRRGGKIPDSWFLNFREDVLRRDDDS